MPCCCRTPRRRAACASRSRCGWTRPIPGAARCGGSPSRANSRCAMRTRAEGPALLAVRALLAVVGLYTAATLQDVLFGTVLAGARVSQQRAFVLAELGVQQALRDIAGAAPAADSTRELRPLPDEAGRATVVLRNRGEVALPAGFSSGRFVAQRFEIESTGHAERGAQAVQVQGVVRVMPQATPELP